VSFVKFTPPAVDVYELPAIDLFSRELSKYASRNYLPPKIEEYLKTAEPIEGGRIILVHGLGSDEVWGINNNGDSFPEHMINDDGVKEATLINSDPNNDWGYITFEKYAHSFADHVNNHPNNTIGGKVILADWNPEMHRVEIVMPINPKMAKTAAARHKAEEAIQRIDRGEPVDVSMGCFIAGTLITMADGSRKPIEEIQVGDCVMTHKGRSRKVTELHKRPYDGVFFLMRPEAHEPFVCTQEHPLLVVDRDDVKKGKSGGLRWVSQEEAARIEPKWIHAECFDPEQHYLLEPVLQDVLTPEYATREFARLLGYYVAEGHVLRNKSKEICGVEFTVNRSDTFLTEIGELAEKYGTKNPPVMRQRDNCDDAVSVQIFDAELANRLYSHGGSYAKHKKLSESFMQWHPDIQREFVGAWAEGDGHGLDSGALSISTGSDALAWQLMTVLARMGACASINCLTHKAGSGFSKKTTYEWVIHIGKQWAQNLHDVCLKVKDSPILLAKNNRMHTGKFIVTPVREMEASRNSVDVYNFEVEEDESYVAAGVAVHNCKVAYDVCKICKNKAKNRSEYCDHAKYAMGQVMSDGRRVGVDNPRPKFFDISYVKRGADRAAKLLMKVASTTTVVRVPDWPDRHKKASKGAEDKHSAIKKQIPGEAVDPINALAERAEVDVLKSTVPFDMSTSEALPPKVARLFNVYPAADVLSTLTAVGVILLPHELPEKVASERFYAKEPNTNILDDIDIHDLMVKRSMYTPFLVMRLMRKGASSGFGKKVASDMAADSAAMKRYERYVNFLKTSFQTSSQVEGWNKMVTASHRIVETLASESDKVLGLWKDAGFPDLDDDTKALLGTEWSRASSLVKAALQQGWSDLGTKIKDVGQQVWSGVKGDVANLAGKAKGLGAKALSAAKPVADVGAHALGVGGGPYPASALLAYGGAPLVMSSFFADKMRRGEDPGAVGQFVAKHPLLSSGASILGSLWLHRMANRYR